MNARLIKEKGGKLFSKIIKVETSPEKLKGLLNDQRWEILKLITERPTYPAEIAKKLKIHEQKVYYHIKQLEINGIIKVINKVEKKGALAKFYAPTCYGFALDLPYGDEKLIDFPLTDQSDKLKQFLYPHMANGRLNSTIVVGSPDPHGPHQVRSRDGHYAIELGLFLGQFGSKTGEFSARLDVDIKAEKKTAENLFLVGGILTNIITKDLNTYLPIRFLEDKFPYRSIYSQITNKTYSEDNIGIIAKITNPANTEKSIIVLAGNTNGGTKAAIIACTRNTDNILKKYSGEDNWSTLVRGFDMDGDGKIDTIKILE
ncbi:MAG: helix-turn-helix domain-containing protein [archaeon]